MNLNLNININIMEVKRYKAGSLKGEITTAEIRKLIRAHNKASSIKIPPKSSREDIVEILQKAGYVVNHEKAELRPVSKGKVQKLKVVSQKTIEQELPKPKTKEEKETARKLNLKKKQDKEAELIKKGATLQRLISKKKV
jgi:ribosomal protein S8